MSKRFTALKNAKYVDVDGDKVVYVGNVHPLDNMQIAHGYNKPLFEALVPGKVISDEYDTGLNSTAVDVEPITDEQVRIRTKTSIKSQENIDDANYRTKFIFW